MVCVSPPTGRFEANREEVIRCLAQTMKSHSFPWAKKHVCQSADYEGLLTVWVHHANRVLVDVKSVRFSFNKFLVISKKCSQLIAPSIGSEGKKLKLKHCICFFFLSLNTPSSWDMPLIQLCRSRLIIFILIHNSTLALPSQNAWGLLE